MKPEFALSLTHEGIRLLQRSDEGWLLVGDVALASDAVDEKLAKLRQKAEEFAAETPIHTKVVLPNTEVLYLEVDVGGATGPDYEAAIREALDGRTPYTLDELSYDYVVTGNTAQLAVVARETLAEAEDFATAHKFNPVSFVAIPPKVGFAGEPMFGTTRAAETLLKGDASVERDTIPVVVVGKAMTSKAPAASEQIETPPAPQTEGPKAPATDAQKTGLPKAPPLKPVTPPPQDPPKADATRPALRASKPEKAAPDADAKRQSQTPQKRLGLMVTAGLLAVMLCVGVIAALRGPAPEATPPETAETAPIDDNGAVSERTGPDTAVAQADAPAADPVAPAPSSENVDAGDPPIETAQPPAETASIPPETAPAPSVMPEMDSALEAPRPSSVTPFDSVPLPEEVAEGEEAAPTETAVAQGSAGAPTAQPDRLAPAPIAGAGPGLLETETFYAVTGIWQRSPEQGLPSRAEALEGLYIASLDAAVEIDDALALPAYDAGRDGLFETPQPPIAPGLVFEFDDAGRVVATEDGALSPDGVLVYSGAGSVRPAARPFNTTPSTDVTELAGIRPAPRPSNATELVERAVLDGRTRAELAALSPEPRPRSAQQEALEAADSAPSALAVAQAPAPPPRPSRITSIVAEIRAAQARQSAAASTASTGAASSSAASLAAPAPTPAPAAIPTTASVARQATLEDAMRLDRANLIGVYGTTSDRRALVRTASGRYVKLQVGDRFDGGRVAAIGEASMQYTKGSRNITLEMPNG